MLQTTTERRTGGGAACRSVAGAVTPVISATSIAPAINVVDVPMPRRGRWSVFHLGLNDGGHAGGERFAQRGTKFVCRADSDSVGAIPAGQSGVIHAVGLSVALEEASETGAVVRLFQTGDCAVGGVIHHQPNDGKVGFHRSSHDGGVAP